MPWSSPPSHLVIFGRPGSGKSSLAEHLGDEHGYTLVRTGELLRAAIRRNDHLGRRVEVHLAKGELVPDRLIFELLEQSLQEPGSQKLLFDGFPRTMGQVHLLEQFEERLHFRVGAYLEIAVSREEAIERMTGRRICPVCGATYHIKNKPPRISERCDLDGARLEGRTDDVLEVIDLRQRVYDEFAVPVLEHYQQVAPDRFVRIDGEQPIQKVYEDTLRALGLADS